MNRETVAVADLVRLFGFTADELALNRMGRLSDRQRQTIVFRSIGLLVRGAALLVLIVVLALTIAPTLDAPWQTGLFGVFCLLGLTIAGLLIHAAATIARPHVHSATGSLKKSGDACHPAITIGGVTLCVGFRRWKRLPAVLPGTVRAYYGPDLSLLSLEPAAKDG